MIDILIIGSFVAARLSRSVQVFLMRFLEELHVHVILNAAFILIVVILLQNIRKRKRLAHTETRLVREYFVGFRRGNRVDVLLGLCVSGILLGIGAVFSLFKVPPAPAFFSTSSFFWAIALIVLASFVEEVFFRSYIIAFLQHMGLNTVFIVIFSAFSFAFGHVSYGIHGVLFAFSAGIILSCFMVMRKSLWANTIAHGTYNIIVYSLAFF